MLACRDCVSGSILGQRTFPHVRPARWPPLSPPLVARTECTSAVCVSQCIVIGFCAESMQKEAIQKPQEGPNNAGRSALTVEN